MTLMPWIRRRRARQAEAELVRRVRIEDAQVRLIGEAVARVIARPDLRRRSCIADTKAGRRCKHFAMPGKAVCKVHAGRIPRVIAPADLAAIQKSFYDKPRPPH